MPSPTPLHEKKTLEFHASELNEAREMVVGIPVCYEHRHNQTIGTVTGSYLLKNGSLVVSAMIDTSTKLGSDVRNMVSRRELRDLSLCLDYDDMDSNFERVGGLKPVELSVVERGRMPKARIVAYSSRGREITTLDTSIAEVLGMTVEEVDQALHHAQDQAKLPGPQDGPKLTVEDLEVALRLKQASEAAGMDYAKAEMAIANYGRLVSKFKEQATEEVAAGIETIRKMGLVEDKVLADIQDSMVAQTMDPSTTPAQQQMIRLCFSIGNELYKYREEELARKKGEAQTMAPGDRFQPVGTTAVAQGGATKQGGKASNTLALARANMEVAHEAMARIQAQKRQRMDDFSSRVTKEDLERGASAPRH